MLPCRFSLSFAASHWVSMPLGAADAAAQCGSRGIAAKKGGEKMTVNEEAAPAAVAAVYSIAMRLAGDYRDCTGLASSSRGPSGVRLRHWIPSPLSRGLEAAGMTLLGSSVMSFRNAQ
jgi:hypothetical protein